MNKLCIDLCSGLGGFSQAFVDAGWEVVRIDIDKKFKPTIQADVQHLPLKTGLRPKIVLASPPCNCFSIASVFIHWKEGIPADAQTLDAIDLVRFMRGEIERVNPDYYLIENPMGMLRTVIGKPNHAIRLSDYGARYKKPTDLWGNVPFPLLGVTKDWQKAPRGSKCGLMAKEIRNPAERAKMPYGLSQAILDAVSQP